MRSWFDSKLFPSVSLFPDGRIKMVNERFRSMFLPQIESYQGIPFSGLLISKEVDLMMRCLIALNQNPDTSITLILRLPTQKNQIEVVEWEFFSHASSNEQVEEITAIGRIKESHISNLPEVNAFVYHQRYLDSLVDLLLIVDRNTRIVRLNRKFERYFQLNRVNWLGLKLQDYPIPGMSEVLIDAINQALINQQSQELIIDDFDGLVIVKYKIAIIPEGVLVIGRDITQRQRHIEKLKKSKEKLNAILNSTTDSNLFLATDGTVMSYNKVTEIEMRTVFKKELKIGAPISAYLPERLSEDFQSAFAEALQGKTIVKEFQLNWSNYSAWYELKYQPVYEEQGQLIGISFNSRYTDHFKRLIDQLRKRTEILNAVFNSTQSAFILLDFQGRITYLNQVAEWLLLSLSGSTVKLGEAIIGYFPPHYGPICKQKWELALRGVQASLQMALESHLHGIQYYWAQFHPVKDENGKQFGASMVLINRTHQHQQLERLATQNRTLAKIAAICSENWPIPIRLIRDLEEKIRLEPSLASRYVPDLLEQARKLDEMIHSVNSMINEISLQDME